VRNREPSSGGSPRSMSWSASDRQRELRYSGACLYDMHAMKPGEIAYHEGRDEVWGQYTVGIIICRLGLSKRGREATPNAGC
jgi:hypothetical protein